jgi:capsule polysaccharide export protein KpsE/RkpR
MDGEKNTPSQSLVNESGEVNFARVWSILASNYRAILFFSLSVAAVTGVVNKFFIPSYFRSSAMIVPRADRSSDSSNMFKSVMGAAGGAPLGQILSDSKSNVELVQFENILKSRRLAIQVGDHINFKELVGMDRRLPEAAYGDFVHAWLGKRLKLKGDKNSLMLGFEHTDAQLAATILKAYISGLESFLQTSTNTRAKAAESFIKGRLEEATANLKTLEANYVELQKSAGVLEINSQASLTVSAAAQLRTQLMQKEMEIDLNRGLFKDDSQLKRLYAERDQIKAQLDKLYTGKGKRGDVLKPMSNLPDLTSSFANVQSEYLAQKAVTDFLRQQYEMAQIEAKRTESMFQIVDEPFVPYFRAGPDTKGNTLIAFAVSVLFACLFILIVHRFKDSQSLPRPLLRIIKTDFPARAAGFRRS